MKYIPACVLAGLKYYNKLKGLMYKNNKLLAEFMI